MFIKPALALAAIGAASASPLVKRQAAVTTAAPAVSSAASSVASSVSSVVESAVSMTAMDSMASSSMPASSMMSSSMAGAPIAASTGATTGNQSYPNYPCPAGTLLTYAMANQTFMVPVTTLTSAFGDWASSPLFPNVTNPTGGSTVGATHTINIEAVMVSIPEVLVSDTTNITSGYRMLVWNNTAPATVMGVTLNTYQTVVQMYDPDYTTTGSIGNSSIAVTFTNACFSDQTAGQSLLTTLAGLELGNLATAVSSGGSNSTTSSSSTMMASSMATDAATMASSMATDAASMASSAATGAVSGASSAATGAASAVSSALVGAPSAVASAVSSVAA